MADRNTPNSSRRTAASRRASREQRKAEAAEARAIEDDEDAIEDNEDAIADGENAIEDDEYAIEDEEDAIADEERAIEEDAAATEDEEDAIDDRRRRRKNGGRRRRREKKLEQGFYQLLKLCKEMNGGSPEIVDAISTSLMTTMGSVPSYSIGETMISASQAQGQMLVNSVANQQRTNIVGMVATVGSVAQLLDMRPDRLWREFEEEEDDLV